MLYVPHDSGVYLEGLRRRADSKMGRRVFPVEKDLELDGKGSWVYKITGKAKPIEW